VINPNHAHKSQQILDHPINWRKKRKGKEKEEGENVSVEYEGIIDYR
jgi:hypothetical protein